MSYTASGSHSSDPLGTALPSDPLGTALPSDPMGTALPSDPLGTMLPSDPLGTALPSDLLGTIGSKAQECINKCMLSSTSASRILSITQKTF